MPKKQSVGRFRTLFGQISSHFHPNFTPNITLFPAYQCTYPSPKHKHEHSLHSNYTQHKNQSFPPKNPPPFAFTFVNTGRGKPHYYPQPPDAFSKFQICFLTPFAAFFHLIPSVFLIFPTFPHIPHRHFTFSRPFTFQLYTFNTFICPKS